MEEPRELTYATCRTLLAGGVVGRVAICTPTGPRIFPVNYAVVDDSIVFRTAPYTVLGTFAWRSPLAFEVDHLDYEYQRGWSVVATGQGRRVDDPDEIAAIQASWDPRPWAAGTRRQYVRLAWDELSGRQLGAGWSSVEAMVVRRSV